MGNVSQKGCCATQTGAAPDNLTTPEAAPQEQTSLDEVQAAGTSEKIVYSGIKINNIPIECFRPLQFFDDDNKSYVVDPSDAHFEQFLEEMRKSNSEAYNSYMADVNGHFAIFKRNGGDIQIPTSRPGPKPTRAGDDDDDDVDYYPDVAYKAAPSSVSGVGLGSQPPPDSDAGVAPASSSSSGYSPDDADKVRDGGVSLRFEDPVQIRIGFDTTRDFDPNELQNPEVRAEFYADLPVVLAAALACHPTQLVCTDIEFDGYYFNALLAVDPAPAANLVFQDGKSPQVPPTPGAIVNKIMNSIRRHAWATDEGLLSFMNDITLVNGDINKYLQDGKDASAVADLKSKKNSKANAASNRTSMSTCHIM